MSLLTALREKWNYSVESPGTGRLLYYEGNREYTFPLYEEDGVLVLVDAPSRQRTHYFFSWQLHPTEYTAVTRARILPRIQDHLRSRGAQVRIHDCAADTERSLEFHPELFEHRARAIELLEEAGYNWFSDYGSIDPMHEEYGLEIGGVPHGHDVEAILTALKLGSPHWHHHHVCFHEHGREPGWAIMIHMLPMQSCPSDFHDES